MTTSEFGISRLVDIVRRLSGADDIRALLEEIASGAIEIVGADGCTLWLLDPAAETLVHEIAITCSLGLSLRHEDSNGSMDLPMSAPAFAAAVARAVTPMRVRDIYESDFPASSAKRFDVVYNYRTRSLMAAPVLDLDHRLIGVIMAVNSAGEEGFDAADESMLAALASCAGIAIVAHRRMESSRGLFRSMVRVIAKTIEICYPHVADHAHRLPRLVDRLAETMDRRGYPGFALDASARESLWLASMLHDCGLLAVHDSVMQKKTRLSGIVDRIEIIGYRAKLIEANIACALARGRLDTAVADRKVTQVREALHWLQIVNDGAVTLSDADVRRLQEIAALRFPGPDGHDGDVLLVDAADFSALSTREGVLSDDEKAQVRRHVDQSVLLLEQIPWPRDLADVPAIVACHHERLDGSGYPRGIREMPLMARMLSMCDVFDGITAPRRYGRRRKSAEEAVAIMEGMAQDGKIDPDLWRFFVANGLHLFDPVDGDEFVGKWNKS